MSRRFNLLFAGAAFALYAAAGACAYAQPATDAPHRHMRVRIERDGGEARTVEIDGDAIAMRREAHRTQMAEHLRAVLQLRPNQEAALSAYVDAMSAGPDGRMMRMRDHDAPKTTPERLAAREKAMADEQAAMHARHKAILSFYGQLDAGQKRAFDELHGENHAMRMRMVRFAGPRPPEPPAPPPPPGA